MPPGNSMSTVSFPLFPTEFLYQKLSSDATEPQRDFDEYIGLDLFSAQHCIIPAKCRRVCLTDIAIQCPPGYYACA